MMTRIKMKNNVIYEFKNTKTKIFVAQKKTNEKPLKMIQIKWRIERESEFDKTVGSNRQF